MLEDRLLYDPAGVMSVYQDNGYLFSNIQPVEVLVENDSIDIEMRVYEGKQARVNKVTISGNTRTNDNVVIREIRTRPGSLYKRSEVQRTIRELAHVITSYSIHYTKLYDPGCGMKKILQLIL